MSERLNELRKDVEARIKAYNDALREKADLGRLNRLENEVKDAESAYNNQKMLEVFDWAKAQPNPMLAAVEKHVYPILKHRQNKEDGIVTGMALVEDRTKQIDILKLAKHLNMPCLWLYKIERFGNLLCMRVAKDIGYTKKEIAEIDNLYYCSAISKAEEMGAVPTSNNQIVKLLQTIIDSILPLDEKTGKAKFRCNSNDAAFLLYKYTARDNSDEMTVKVAKTSYVVSIVTAVMHHIVTGKRYTVDYKKKNAETAAAANKTDAAAKIEKISANESETVSIPRPTHAAKAEVPAPEAATEVAPAEEAAEATVA